MGRVLGRGANLEHTEGASAQVRPRFLSCEIPMPEITPRQRLLLTLLTAMIDRIDPNAIEAVADWLLNRIEDAIKDSPSPVDDAVFLPLLKKVREAYGIEDHDDDEGYDDE